MCGIIGYVGGAPAIPVLLAGLKRLEYRGYDSAGLALQAGDRLVALKSVGKVAGLAEKTRLTWTAPEQQAPRVGIAHTRWATHGAPTEPNAHPHFAEGGGIALVHNGIIENYRALRVRLEAKGHVFVSETDTEALARLIGEAFQGDLRAAVIAALRQVEGAYGIAVLSRDEPGVIVAARKGSPLVIGVGEGECLVASDPAAIIAHTRRVIYLDDGDVARVTADHVDIVDLDAARIDRSVGELGFAADAVEKGGFEHFMLKEIHEQPETAALWVARHLPEVVAGEATPLVALPLAAEVFEGVERIQILACGTSRHAAQVGAYLLEQLAGISTSVFYASEFRYAPPPLSAHTLTIGVTQSGETADTLAALAIVMPLLNLLVPADSPFHVSTYTITLLGKYLSYALLALAVGQGFQVEEADVIAAQLREEEHLSDAELQRRAGEEARRLRSFIPG